jgi:acyl-CoA dehydrogenase
MLGGWCLARAGLALPAGPVGVVEVPVATDGGRLHFDAVVAWGRHAERIVAIAEDDGLTRVLSVRADQVTIAPGANLAGEARDRVVADVALADVEQAVVPADRVDAAQLRRRGALSRVLLAAGALSAMSQMTIDYTNERRQFGKPVATFQAVQHHLVTVAQCAVRAQMAADVAVRALAAGTLGAEVALARVVADDATTLGTRAAHQAHGAMGVTREYPLQQLSRRLWSWRGEWGTTREWRREAGRAVVAAGPDALFDLVVR